MNGKLAMTVAVLWFLIVVGLVAINQSQSNTILNLNAVIKQQHKTIDRYAADLKESTQTMETLTAATRNVSDAADNCTKQLTRLTN